MLLLEIGLVVGLTSVLVSKKIKLRQRDYCCILGMLVILLGVVISRLFFSPYIPILINIAFVIKILSFFVFVYLFLTRFSFPSGTLFIIAFFSTPHFLAYILEIVPIVNGQFPGLAGDPNYSSPDILSSLVASIYLIDCRWLNKNTKVVFWITFFISIIVLVVSVSRTAILASFLIFIFYALTKSFSRWGPKGKRPLLKLGIILLCVISAIISWGTLCNFISNNHNYIKIYNKFFHPLAGSDLLENERYIVWDLTYNLIQKTGMFQGYGTDNFLYYQYRFGAHNSWLDIGTKMGSYTFWMHSSVFVLGLVMWIYRHLKNAEVTICNTIESFMLIYVIAITFMMFSVSVSHMYYYWFLLFLIYIKGILPHSYLGACAQGDSFKMKPLPKLGNRFSVHIIE